MKLMHTFLPLLAISLASCGGEISTRGGKVVGFTVPVSELRESVDRVMALSEEQKGSHVLWAGHDVEIDVRGDKKTSKLSVMVDGPWHLSDDIVIRVHEDLASQGLTTGAEQEVQESRTWLSRHERNWPLVKTLRERREKGLPPQ